MSEENELAAAFASLGLDQTVELQHPTANRPLRTRIDGGIDGRSLRADPIPNYGSLPKRADGKSVSYPEIKRLSIKHEAIMDYILTNPTAKVGEIAMHFNVSRGWMSIVINSDVFRQKLAEKQGELFQHTVIPIREKMLGIASLGLDKVAEDLENAQDVEYTRKTTESLLDRLGYGTKPAAAPVGSNQNNTQINNYFSVDPAVLNKARENFGRVTTGEKDLGPIQSAPAEALPTSGDNRERKALPDASADPAAEEAK